MFNVGSLKIKNNMVKRYPPLTLFGPWNRGSTRIFSEEIENKMLVEILTIDLFFIYMHVGRIK